jgi:hypothetical protein
MIFKKFKRKKRKRKVMRSNTFTYLVFTLNWTEEFLNITEKLALSQNMEDDYSKLSNIANNFLDVRLFDYFKF